MARLKKRVSREGDSGKENLSTEIYRDWLHEQKRMIPVEDLEHHPDNWRLVGRLKTELRSALKDDILNQGIREPLHVWVRGEHLYVVSGNERLDIIRELSPEERKARKLAFLPCIKKDFDSEVDVRAHIISVNENRKVVRMSPVDRVLALFPPEENTLLYADFRGKYTEESTTDRIKTPAGDFILSDPENVFQLMEKQRKERERLRSITGWSERFVDKTVAAAAKKTRGKKGFDGGVPLTPELAARARKSREQVKVLGKKINDAEERIKKIKVELARYRIELRKHERVLAKAGLLK